VTHYVIAYRVGGKTRLGDGQLAHAMLTDVIEAVNEAAGEALVVDGPGGQGPAIAAFLAEVHGPVTIVNADVPAVTADELRELTARAPAIVSADDGTTNAVSLRDAADFAPLYGSGSAARFVAHLSAERLALPGLRDDVDTWDDVERIRDRAGKHTQRYLDRLERSRAS